MKANLKANIHYAMEYAGIGPAELSAALRISEQSYYRRMRDPEKRIPPCELEVIARKCRTTSAWLIGGTPQAR